jgi:hypothetical protein
MLPTFYQTHLQKQLTQAQFLKRDNLAGFDTIGKTSQFGEARAGVSLSNYSRKPPSQTAKISRFASINDRTNLVPFSCLLVDDLLQSGTNYINCNRPQPMGLYQSADDRSHLAEKSYSIILVFATKIRQ